MPRLPTLLGALGLAALGCASEADAPAFRTAPVERREVLETVEASGKLEARGRRLVSPAVEGRLVAVEVASGDDVEAGAVLARLETTPFVRRAREAQAAVELVAARLQEAKVLLEDAEREAARMGRLAERGQASGAETAAAKSQVRRARAGASAARAQLEQARLGLAEARAAQEAAVIRAPAAGTVLAARAEVGSLVSPRSPPPFALAEDLAQLRVVALVGEADIGRVARRAKSEVEVEAFPGVVFPARIERREVVPVEGAGVARYPVHLEVEDPERRLLPGMRAIVRFETARAEGALAVPMAALRFAPPGAPEAPPRSRLFVVEGDGATRAVAVRVGLSDGLVAAVEALEGALEAGDEVAIGFRIGSEGSRGANLSLGGR